MVLTSTEITSWIGSYLWPMFRIAALVASAPIFGVRFIPVRVKLVLAVALTILVAPTLHSLPQVDPLGLDGLLIIAHQILVGLVMGFAMNLVFSVFTIGGQIIAMQMGLGFASMVDPQMGTQVPVISQLYIILVSLTFLAFNGHLILLQVLVDSFNTIPIAPHGLTRDGFWLLVSWGGQMFKGAVIMALPAIAALLVVNMALGIVMRAAPQFNILSIGFPITLTLGFFIILVTLPIFIPQVTQQMNAGFGLIESVLSAR
jgi:flagellar biosynthetic protein FliR